MDVVRRNQIPIVLGKLSIYILTALAHEADKKRFPELVQKSALPAFCEHGNQAFGKAGDCQRQITEDSNLGSSL